MGWAVNATPRPLYPGKEVRLLIVWEVGWASRLVWTGAGFDSWTVQPVASHYRPTNYAILTRGDYQN
jgi:hypothetical protein